MCNNMFLPGRAETLFYTLVRDKRAHPVPDRAMALMRFVLPPLGLSLIALRALAQMPGGDPAPADVSFNYSYSAKADLDRGSKLGSASVDHFGFNSVFTLPVNAELKVMGGLSFTDDQFDLKGAVPLPGHLEGFGLNLGAVKDLGQGWSVLAMMHTGFYGDTLAVSGKTFNIGGLLSVEREFSPDFAMSLGVGASERGHYHTLPAIGLRWNFAPDWTLAVGFPRTGLLYRVSSVLSLNAGLQFQGGTYYVGTARGPGLGNTYLDYRELRVGGGLEYKFTPAIGASIGGGVAANRKFDYYERNDQLDGKAAPYLTADLHFRF